MTIETRLARIEAAQAQILAILSPARTQLLTTAQAAPYLHRSPWTIRQLCRAGLIRASHDNGVWRIPSDEIERLQSAGIPRLPRK